MKRDRLSKRRTKGMTAKAKAGKNQVRFSGMRGAKEPPPSYSIRRELRLQSLLNAPRDDDQPSLGDLLRGDRQ